VADVQSSKPRGAGSSENAKKHGKAKKESKIFFMNATSHFFLALAESEEEL